MEFINQANNRELTELVSAAMDLGEQLQTIRENGFPTDVMSCIMAGLLMNGKTEEEVKAFMQEADEAQAPKYQFRCSR